MHSLEQCGAERNAVDFLKKSAASFESCDARAFESAAGALKALQPDGGVKMPAILIVAAQLSNPSKTKPMRNLTLSGLYDPGLFDEPQTRRRLIKHMTPVDAFVSYSFRDDRWVPTHIKVPPQRRGGGIGAHIAIEVSERVRAISVKAHITCSFTRRVAASDPVSSDFSDFKPANRPARL